LQHLEPPGSALQFACAAPTAPPPELLSAQRQALDQLTATAGRTVDLGYHVVGLPRLRAAVADHYSGLDLATDPEQILITNGAQQAISLLVRALVQPGDPVLVETPTYPGALESLRAAGAELVPQSVGMPGLGRTLRGTRPALAYLVPQFHNPTGALLGALQGERLARAAAKADTWLIDDRTLADLPFPGVVTPPPLAIHEQSAGRVITVGSLSKIVWGGLRVGWIRGPRGLINRLARIRALHDCGGTVFTQLAAAIIVDDLAKLREQNSGLLKQRHDQLSEALRRQLPDWSFEPVTGGQFLWIKLPYGDGDSFAQYALRHGVAVLPGSGLDASGESTAYLRLHFQLPNELAQDGIRRLSAAWSQYQPPVKPLVERPKMAV
jgi:DNA-binding transcriptional MocR family regulator